MTDEDRCQAVQTILVGLAAFGVLWRMQKHRYSGYGVCPALEQVLDGTEVSPANVQELHYLQAVILESLRLRPPAYIVGRCAANDVTLGSHRLPQGSPSVQRQFFIYPVWEKATCCEMTLTIHVFL